MCRCYTVYPSAGDSGATTGYFGGPPEEVGGETLFRTEAAVPGFVVGWYLEVDAGTPYAYGGSIPRPAPVLRLSA